MYSTMEQETENQVLASDPGGASAAAEKLRAGGGEP